MVRDNDFEALQAWMKGKSVYFRIQCDICGETEGIPEGVILEEDDNLAHKACLDQLLHSPRSLLRGKGARERRRLLHKRISLQVLHDLREMYGIEEEDDAN